MTGDSPLASVVKLGLVAMGAELAIMLAIDGFLRDAVEVSPIVWQVLDPLLLAAIVAPVLYLWVLRPMLAQEKELRIAAVAFESQNGMMITDAKGVILRVNPAFRRMTGYTAQDVVGRTPAMLKSGRQDAFFYQQMWAILTEKGYWYGELWNKRKNGQIYAELLTITAIRTREGVISHYIGDFSDISETRDATAEVHRLSFYDPLTELPNRRLLQERLARTLIASKRSRHHGALLVIDLDNFKQVNDARGYDVGDLLLVEVARCLRAVLREVDTVAHLGGDKFMMLLEDLGQHESVATVRAEQICAKLRQSMDSLSSLDGSDFQCRYSLGVAVFGPDDAVESLLRNADLALYSAKKSGGNTMRFFDPALQAGINLRAALAAELRLAPGSGQMLLHFQPLVHRSGGVVGVEALLRWQHPKRGLMLPEEFLAIAEDTGLILPISHWVLESACAVLASWSSAALTRELTLSVNVSARQFRQHDFVDLIRAVLQSSGANPARLWLELTEAALLENLGAAADKLQALRQLGVRFALDDFGTGQASLAQLTQLPLDQLKLDRSVVLGLPGKGEAETLARATLSLGAVLHIEVIAEGVETEDQYQWLQDLGCSAYQGFLFSEPLAGEALEDYLQGD
jgi:diguanylate cyclase (GGDEF)-like protein/PAS domain S-box-containing protein